MQSLPNTQTVLSTGQPLNAGSFYLSAVGHVLPFPNCDEPLGGECMQVFRQAALLIQNHALQVFIELGLPEDIHLCLFIYGGQPPGQWELKQDALPEGWVCVVCSGGKPILSDKQLPSNFRLASPDDFIPDLVRPWSCAAGALPPQLAALDMASLTRSQRQHALELCCRCFDLLCSDDLIQICNQLFTLLLLLLHLTWQA